MRNNQNCGRLESLSLIGELTRSDFEVGKLFLKQSGSNRVVEIPMEEQWKSLVIENRHKWIQVSGVFQTDKSGMPIHAVSVDSMVAADLSPIEIRGIKSGTKTIRARTPLRFQPVLDGDVQQLYVVNDENLDLHVFAFTRTELVEELLQHLILAWETYAYDPPNSLTLQAQQLQSALRQTFIDPKESN